MKKAACLLLAAFMAAAVLWPDEAVRAACEGFDVFTGKVLPALLPFLIAAETLLGIGAFDAAARVFSPLMQKVFRCPGAAAHVLLMSFLGGYPLGARLTSSLLRRGEITREEAERMLPLCSSSGPLFIFGTVGTALFAGVPAAAAIAAAHYFSVLLTGFVMARFYPDISYSKPSSGKGLGFAALPSAVRSGVESMLAAGGSIIFASVMLCMAEKLILAVVPGGAPQALAAIIRGITELSAGAGAAADIGGRLGTALTAAFISWGGFSVHVQALAFLPGVRYGRYFFGKIMQSVSAFAAAWLVFPLFCGDIPAFSDYGYLPVYPVSLYACIAYTVFALGAFLIATGICALFIKIGERREKAAPEQQEPRRASVYGRNLSSRPSTHS